MQLNPAKSSRHSNLRLSLGHHQPPVHVHIWPHSSKFAVHEHPFLRYRYPLNSLKDIDLRTQQQCTECSQNHSSRWGVARPSSRKDKSRDPTESHRLSQLCAVCVVRYRLIFPDSHCLCLRRAVWSASPKVRGQNGNQWAYRHGTSAIRPISLGAGVDHVHVTCHGHGNQHTSANAGPMHPSSLDYIQFTRPRRKH